MEQPDCDGAAAYALARLERELSPQLVYHSVRHTRDSVVPAVERLAAINNFPDEDCGLLRTAAWFHDLGFVEQRIEHEAASVRIAALALPRFGYSRAQIATIGGMIMATKLPQTPYNALEATLADADLDVLGAPDFWEQNRCLREELAAFGLVVTDGQWYRDQRAFISGHTYWTAAARDARDAGKARNLARIDAALASHSLLGYAKKAKIDTN